MASDTVSMVPSAPPPPPEVNSNSTGALQGAPDRPGNSIIDLLSTAGHPVTCVFHFAFKVAVLIAYFIGRYFSGDYVITFILATILAALDFWTVKNITGRILVGLRWWNHVKDDGSSQWVFESIPEETMLNSTDRTIFWFFVYLWPAIWAVLLVLNVIAFSLNWVLLDGMVFVFASSNLAGYWKCSADAKRKTREWVEKQGMRAVASAMSSFT